MHVVGFAFLYFPILLQLTLKLQLNVTFPNVIHLRKQLQIEVHKLFFITYRV